MINKLQQRWRKAAEVFQEFRNPAGRSAARQLTLCSNELATTMEIIAGKYERLARETWDNASVPTEQQRTRYIVYLEVAANIRAHTLPVT